MTADGAGTSDVVLLTAADVDRAVAEGVLASSDATKLLAWARARSSTNPSAVNLSVEQLRGLNLVTVAYYCGALLIIGACAWFLGDKWDALGAQGVLATSLIYAIVLASVGVLLLRAGYRVAAGLLITVAVCVTPIVVYAVEDLVGLWPGTNYGTTTMTYATFQYRLASSYLVMELATIVVAAIALWFVRFGFLTAPLAVSFWCLSMDVVSLASDMYMEWNARARITVAVGVLMMLIGVGLDRAQAKRLAARGGPKNEDYGFWLNLFGTLAFWGGLTSMDSHSEAGRLVYLAINVGLILAAVKLGRVAMLALGTLGVHIYLFHLAYDVFRDTFLFPFVLALLGLSLILFTVFAQWYLRHRVKKVKPRIEPAVASDPFADRAGAQRRGVGRPADVP